MNKLAIVVTFFVITACGNTQPTTAPQAAYEGTAGFVVALKAANAYAAMPRCSVTIPPPCSDQATVAKISTSADKAGVAVVAAQNIAKDTTSVDTDRQKAINAANEAVAALVKIIPTQPTKLN